MPHRTRVTREHYSWGASSETASIVMYLAGQALDAALGAAALEAMKRAFDTIGGWAGARSRLPGREEAPQAAKFAVCMAYSNEAHDELEVVAEKELADHRGWVVDLRGEEWVYKVEITLAGRKSTSTRVSRRLGPG